MKQSIRIVTDSTADIPEALRSELGIEMVPLKILLNSETYRDAVDLKAAEFYAKLPSCSTLPTTSQPSPAEFIEVYEKLKEEGADTVISIHLASALSGTHQSAVLASSMLEDGPAVETFDSRSASYGIGMLAVAAAEAARQGKSKEEIVQLVEEMRKETRLYFLVDTLEYLQKGGRIGKAAALVGSLLNLKPILSISDEGVVYSVDKARGQKKAIARIVELLEKDYAGRPIHLTMAHCNAEEAAVQALEKSITDHFDVKSIRYTIIGPVVGTHAGPGALAAFVSPAR